MLQYMGSRQPPRKYVIPSDKPPAPTRKDSCDICQTRTWTSKLVWRIRDAPVEMINISHEYELTSKELRKSVIEGCKFCRTLADGVHGKVFLDDLYARFQKSETWPSDATSDEKTSEGEEEIPFDPEEDEENAQASEAWNEASAFNEDELDGDVTGGWDTWQDRDTLDEQCKFNIKLSFERGEDDLFTFLNVYIEAESASSTLGKLQGDELVELRYHINEEAASQSCLFPITTERTTLGSEANMVMISNWVQSILLVRTQELLGNDQMPSRLIDVEADGGLQVVETSSISQCQQRFAALSYVWGTQQTFILTSDTAELLMSVFRLEQLPQTIQDAVMVTRRLGLRYLWVDALCILQDSNADKAQELPKMRLIYKNATITIVASIANSASQGFLHHMSQSIHFIEPITVPYKTSRTSQSLILSYPAAYNRHHDPINTRAWTFQELLLSVCAIAFTYRGIHLIDRTNPPSSSPTRDTQLPTLPWTSASFSLTHQDHAKLRTTWLAIRGEYSRRRITYPTDKLLGIAAIAAEIARVYARSDTPDDQDGDRKGGGRYVAGLWGKDLELDLQWRCLPSENRHMDHIDVQKGEDTQLQSKPPRAAAYVAPSWSWASVQSSVDDFSFFSEDGGEEGGVGTTSALGFEVLECVVDLVDPSFEFGAVKGGRLLVRGRVLGLVWRPHGEWEMEFGETDGFLGLREEKQGEKQGERGEEGEEEVTIGEATIDASDEELVHGVEVTCLATRAVEHIPGRDEVEGMMLLRVSGEEQLFRRVGFFKVYATSHFDDIQVQSISII